MYQMTKKVEHSLTSLGKFGPNAVWHWLSSFKIPIQTWVLNTEEQNPCFIIGPQCGTNLTLQSNSTTRLWSTTLILRGYLPKLALCWQDGVYDPDGSPAKKDNWEVLCMQSVSLDLWTNLDELCIIQRNPGWLLPNSRGQFPLYTIQHTQLKVKAYTDLCS